MRKNNQVFQRLMAPLLLVLFLLESCGHTPPSTQSERVKYEPASIDQDKKIAYLEEQIEALKASQKGCAKAWVIFNGQGPTILDSYGISSIRRNHVGDYTIKF